MKNEMRTEEVSVPTTPNLQVDEGKLLTRTKWKELGYCVPAKAEPDKIDVYQVPGYRSVWRESHLFAFAKVYKISEEVSSRRKQAAAAAVATRIRRMIEAIETVELTIVRGKSTEEIHALALRTHGGNYQGDPGPFHWSNAKARAAIRHCLTNYEQQWAKINRGFTGAKGYTILRDRVDALVNAEYPQFGPGEPEVQIKRERRQ